MSIQPSRATLAKRNGMRAVYMISHFLAATITKYKKIGKISLIYILLKPVCLNIVIIIIQYVHA